MDIEINLAIALLALAIEAATGYPPALYRAIGHPVTRLVRTRIGPLADRRLEPGTWRHLDPAEVRALAEATA